MMEVSVPTGGRGPCASPRVQVTCAIFPLLNCNPSAPALCSLPVRDVM